MIARPFANLTLLIGLAFAQTPLPTPIGLTPDPKWLADLEHLTLQAAQTAPDLEKLIRDSQTQSKTTTLAGFLATIKICDNEGTHAAQVSQLSSQRYFFISRDLDETSDAKPDDLIKFYAPRVQSNLAKGAEAASLSWHFGDDVIVVHTVETSRTLCVRSGLTSDQAVEVLAHEMVHYTRGIGPGSVDRAIHSKDARDYAEKTVDEPGDEVDAYLEEDSLRIRRRGDGFFKANPQLAIYYNDYGTFVGRREKMAAHILDELHYFVNRFKPEYKVMLQNQLSYETQLLAFNEGLLKSRIDDVKGNEDFMKSRFKVFNGLMPSYREETARGRKLLDGATQSQKRLSLEIPKEKARIEQLQARLKGL